MGLYYYQNEAASFSSCMEVAIFSIQFEWVWSVFRKLFLGQISSDLQMVDGGASGSEGSDISGIDEYIPDHFDGETDGFRHKFTLVLPSDSEGPGLGQCLAVKLVWRVGRVGRSTIWRLSPQLGDRFGSVPDENGS